MAVRQPPAQDMERIARLDGNNFRLYQHFGNRCSKNGAERIFEGERCPTRFHLQTANGESVICNHEKYTNQPYTGKVMEAPKIKFILNEAQLEKFCNMFGLDIAAVEPLNSLACLNTEYIRDILIRADYDQLTRGIEYLQTVNRKYNYIEVTKALAKSYRLPQSTVNSILQGKNNSKTMQFCKRCGKRITGRTKERTGGLCSECMTDTLNL